MSIPFMKKKGVTFQTILDAYEQGTFKELQRTSPIYEVFLDMVIKHLPNPKESQKYRIPKIWHGDSTSPMGKSLVECNKSGDPVFEFHQPDKTP